MEEGRGGPTKKHLIYVSDSLFDMKLTYIYMLLYMQAPSEAPVLEEHQTGGPPFTHQQVCLCRSLSLYVCVHISRSSNIQCVSLIWTCNMFYMQVAQDEYIVSGSIPTTAEVESQHPVRVAVSEAPGPQITYSHTISRNVILVSRNLNKCIYRIFKGW